MTSLPVIFLFGRHSFEHPPPGSDFDALPLPWGALHLRAYACPAWRVMSIAPAGSSSNSVHLKKKKKKKKGQAAHPQFAEELGAGKGGGGVMEPELSDSVSLSLSFSHSLTTYLCRCSFIFSNSFIIQLTEPRLNDLSDFAWHVVEREPDQNDLKTSATSHL